MSGIVAEIISAEGRGGHGNSARKAALEKRKQKDGPPSALARIGAWPVYFFLETLKTASNWASCEFTLNVPLPVFTATLKVPCTSVRLLNFNSPVAATSDFRFPAGLLASNETVPQQTGQTQRQAMKIWFPAKRYGWGWGFPTCWQGWVVVAIYLAAVALCAWLLSRHTALYIGMAIGFSAILLLICWLKGEKPRWRWGAKDDA